MKNPNFSMDIIKIKPEHTRIKEFEIPFLKTTYFRVANLGLYMKMRLLTITTSVLCDYHFQVTVSALYGYYSHG